MVTTPEHGTSPGHAYPLVRRDTLTASVCLTRAFLPLPWVFGVSRSYTVPRCALSCPHRHVLSPARVPAACPSHFIAWLLPAQPRVRD